MRTPCSTWNLSPASADGSLSRALEATASSVRGYAPPHRVATLKADQSEDRDPLRFMRPMCEKCAGLYYSVVELSFEIPRFGLGTSFVMIFGP